MKKLLKYFVYISLSLLLANTYIRGLYFGHDLETFLLAAAALTVAMLLIRPIVNLLLLPFNLLTFGLFRWLSFSLTFYLVTLLVEDFKITKFYFPGYHSYWFDLPEIALGGVGGYIAFSLAISFLTTFLLWLQK